MIAEINQKSNGNLSYVSILTEFILNQIISYVSTFTEFILNQKKINLCEHTVKMTKPMN